MSRSAPTAFGRTWRCSSEAGAPAYAPTSPPATSDTGAAAGGQALTDSTLILEGLAAARPPERLHLRVADHQGTIYIDTGRPDGQVIRIGQGRWAVANTAPVHFLRTKLTGAMPVPPQDGDVARLWDFVNVAAEDRPVLLAVLVSALVQCDVRVGALR